MTHNVFSGTLNPTQSSIKGTGQQLRQDLVKFSQIYAFKNEIPGMPLAAWVIEESAEENSDGA